MARIKFILKSKIESLTSSKEYIYIILVESNTGIEYISYNYWNAYAETAKEAKEKIMFNLAQTQAFDYILDNQIIKDSNGNPYFSIYNNSNVNPVFSDILRDIEKIPVHIIETKSQY